MLLQFIEVGLATLVYRQLIVEFNYITCTCCFLCRVLHADFKVHKVIYMASNNIKGIGKSIATTFCKSIGIGIGDTFSV